MTLMKLRLGILVTDLFQDFGMYLVTLALEIVT